jgi:hypothetical protein
MFNAGPVDQLFTVVPPLEGKRWFRALDTGLPSPNDISGEGSALERQDRYQVKAHSIVALLSK